MPTWYCASASPLLANATIALKVPASFALAGIEKNKRPEKAKATNFKAINFMSVPPGDLAALQRDDGNRR
jgi:hypothetical protein